MNKNLQTIYLSHGGGPLPLLGDKSHEKMIHFLQHFSKKIRKPDVIIVVSAHWECSNVTIQTNSNPPMLYDYFGFPKDAYNVKYPAPGEPEFAQTLMNLLNKQNIESIPDAKRGYDHGCFIPLLLMFPNADIPTLQMSIYKDLSPERHLQLGKALAHLSTPNVLIIGSGSSFHNFNSFNLTSPPIVDDDNNLFQDWLIKTCTGSISQTERESLLNNWEKAPSARYCHPREDHLLPLHVCVGLAGTKGNLVFDDYIAGKRTVSFLWE